MMSKLLLALAGASALPVEDINASWPHGYWCAAGPVNPKAPVAHHAGASFRGQFQDLSLWVEASTHTLHDCDVIEPHHHGNDGLWVIEFDTDEMMKREKAKIWRAGLKVMAERKHTLVVAGGEKVPNSLEYDACGMEQDLRIISVSDHGVRGPREYAERLDVLRQERVPLTPGCDAHLRVVSIIVSQEGQTRQNPEPWKGELPGAHGEHLLV